MLHLIFCLYISFSIFPSLIRQHTLAADFVHEKTLLDLTLLLRPNMIKQSRKVSLIHHPFSLSVFSLEEYIG